MKGAAYDPYRTAANKDILAYGEHLIMRDARKESFLKRASHSLKGHIVLVQIWWTIPMLFAFSDSMYSGGVLTFGRVLYLLSVVIAAPSVHPDTDHTTAICGSISSHIWSVRLGVPR